MVTNKAKNYYTNAIR